MDLTEYKLADWEIFNLLEVAICPDIFVLHRLLAQGRLSLSSDLREKL